MMSALSTEVYLCSAGDCYTLAVQADGGWRMATTGHGYVEHQEFQEFRTDVNERFDGVDARFDGIDARLNGIDVQLNDLRVQIARMAEQVARIVELMTENTDIQKRQLGLLEAAQRSQDQ